MHDRDELDATDRPLWFCTLADKRSWFAEASELYRQDAINLLARWRKRQHYRRMASHGLNLAIMDIARYGC